MALLLCSPQLCSWGRVCCPLWLTRALLLRSLELCLLQATETPPTLDPLGPKQATGLATPHEEGFHPAIQEQSGEDILDEQDDSNTVVGCDVSYLDAEHPSATPGAAMQASLSDEDETEQEYSSPLPTPAPRLLSPSGRSSVSDTEERLVAEAKEQENMMPAAASSREADEMLLCEVEAVSGDEGEARLSEEGPEEEEEELASDIDKQTERAGEVGTPLPHTAASSGEKDLPAAASCSESEPPADAAGVGLEGPGPPDGSGGGERVRGGSSSEEMQDLPEGLLRTWELVTDEMENKALKAASAAAKAREAREAAERAKAVAQEALARAKRARETVAALEAERLKWAKSTPRRAPSPPPSPGGGEGCQAGEWWARDGSGGCEAPALATSRIPAAIDMEPKAKAGCGRTQGEAVWRRRVESTFVDDTGKAHIDAHGVLIFSPYTSKAERTQIAERVKRAMETHGARMEAKRIKEKKKALDVASKSKRKAGRFWLQLKRALHNEHTVVKIISPLDDDEALGYAQELTPSVLVKTCISPPFFSSMC